MVKVLGVQKTIKELNNKVSKTIKKSVEAEVRSIVSDLKAATPVDTGRARDWWNSDSKSIYNEVEYIDKLNAGSSRQAPSFFVESTILSHGSVTPSGIIVRNK